MINLKYECGTDEAEQAECAFIDAVLAIMPGADVDHIADLMPSGYTPKQVAAELKAQEAAK